MRQCERVDLLGSRPNPGRSQTVYRHVNVTAGGGGRQKNAKNKGKVIQ